MPVSAELRTAYNARRAYFFGRDAVYGGSTHATMCLSYARDDIARGRTIPDRRTYLEHGSVIRARKADGSRATFVVAHVPDSDMGAPWEEHDGHGVIRAIDRDHTKAPGERLFTSGDDFFHYAYDIAETMRLALADGWGISPEARAELTKKIGREPTRRQIAAAAVELDFQRMQAWAQDEWSWIGVCLVEMPRDGEWNADGMESAYGVACKVSEGFGAFNVRASLWGIEGDSGAEYFDEVARELVSEAAGA